MTPTKAHIKQVEMPHGPIHDVRQLHQLTQMTHEEFRDLVKMIRENTLAYLNASGSVTVEQQDPDALRNFLDQVKKDDPTIAKRYPHLWPVLAYVELYLYGRSREYVRRRRHLGSSAYASPRPGVLYDLPIWIRFSISEMTGLPFQEVCRREIPVSRGSGPRFTHRRPTCQRCGEKMDRSIRKSERTVTKHRPNAQEIRNGLSGHINNFSIAMQNLLQSVSTFIEDISPYIVSG